MQIRRSMLLKWRFGLAGLRLLALLATAAGVRPYAALAQLPTSAPRKAGQGYSAAQFLQAVLRADYLTAYAALAPEVRKSVTIRSFETAARPLWKSGQRHGSAIELYKLGVRMGEGQASRFFYSFSFAADSALKTPSALLEVTFRDTTSRAVLGFGLHYPAVPARSTKPVLKSARK